MGSLLGGEETSTQTTQDRVYLPGYAEGPLKQALSLATDAAETPFQAYTDPRFAEFNPDEVQAFDMTRGLVGSTAPSTQQALSTTQDVMRQGLQGIDPSLIQSYMNPFTEQVIDTQNARNLQEFQRQQTGLQQQQGQTGAFGGSRSAIAQGLLSDNFARNQAEQNAMLQMQNYSQALGASQQGLQMAGQGAVNLSNLAGQGLGQGLQEAGMMQNIGMQQRGLQQQGLDFGYDEFMREQAHPYQQAQFLSGIAQPIAATVAGRDSTVTQTQESSGSPLGAALGIASMAMGIPGVGAALGGGLGAGLGSMFGGGIGNAIGAMGGGSGMMGGIGAAALGSSNPFTSASGAFKMGSAGQFGPYNKGGLVNKYNEGGLTLGDSTGSRNMLASAMTPQMGYVQPKPLPAGQAPAQGGGGDDGGGGLGEIAQMAMMFLNEGGQVGYNQGGYYNQGGQMGYNDGGLAGSVFDRYAQHNPYAPQPTDTRLDMLGGKLGGLSSAIRTAPYRAGKGLVDYGMDLGRGAMGYLQEQPLMIEAESQLGGLRGQYEQQQAALEQGLASQGKDPSGIPVMQKAQENLSLLQQQLPTTASETRGPLKGRTMTYDDIVAKTRQSTKAPDSNKALMAFGAHMLSSSDDFFKALGGATQAYQGAKSDEANIAIAKEKAIQDIAANQFQKELNARQIAATEQMMQMKQQMAPFEMQLKKAQLQAAIAKAGGTDKDVDRAITMYEANPNADPSEILQMLGVFKQGQGGEDPIAAEMRARGLIQ